MNKQQIILIVAAALVVAAVPAQAGFISLNAPDDPGPTFTQLGDGSFQVSGVTTGRIAGYQYTNPPPGLILQNAGVNFDSNFTGTGAGSLSFNTTILNSGVVIAVDSMTASIKWVLATANTMTASLSGIGTVLTSSGDAAFEDDFPVGGIFNIDPFYLTSCGRFPITCGPNPPIGGSTILINGDITPVSVPAPPLGISWMMALLTLALPGIRRLWSNEH